MNVAVVRSVGEICVWRRPSLPVLRTRFDPIARILAAGCLTRKDACGHAVSVMAMKLPSSPGSCRLFVSGGYGLCPIEGLGQELSYLCVGLCLA